jgi:serine/threonine protein kinase
VLGDHAVHRFSVGTDVTVNEMTLQMTGHNNAGSPQLHVGRFILGGRICSRSSMLDGRSVISAIVAEIHKVGIPAKRESHTPQLMMEIPDLEDVETLSGSRFGHIRVARAVSGELFAVERYNTGASTATQSAIVLTPFSGIRSLDDVLTQVRQGTPPPLWNNATITRILIQVARGLDYLHRQTIVHANLKPSDIIADDGSAKVCGYLTAFLEDTGLTQVSGSACGS